jgi:pimeloyl-ACP methyl ester carboxylesterase
MSRWKASAPAGRKNGSLRPQIASSGGRLVRKYAILAAVQRPLAVACVGVPVDRPLWKDKPSWVLIAEEDRMISPETQRFTAERMGARARGRAVDHVPMITAPAEVVDIILEAVREVATTI